MVGGPILAALADRLPWRRTMVACDLIRAGVVGLLAWPGIPLPILLALLFASALVAPPFEAARSALMPVAIPGDAFVLANSLQSVLRQTTQVAGFLIAGVLVALLNARGALLADALTFALSAAAIRLWIKHRDAPPKHPERRSLLQETVDGMRLVLGHKVLRPYLILAFITSGCVYASEGLSAPFAKHLNGGGPQVIGILLASIPIGEAIGAIVLGRFASPTLRPKLVVPMAIMSGCVLVPIALDPPLPVVSLLYALSGFGVSCMTIVNANYVRAIAPQFRGRAFGVAQSGLQISQGVGVLIAGALASVLLPPHVVALCGAAGALGIMLLASALAERQTAGRGDGASGDRTSRKGLRLEWWTWSQPRARRRLSTTPSAATRRSYDWWTPSTRVSRRTSCCARSTRSRTSARRTNGFGSSWSSTGAAPPRIPTSAVTRDCGCGTCLSR